MRNLFSGIFLALFGILFLAPYFSNAQQVSPYSIPPKWRFGYQAGMSFPLSGTPSVIPGFNNPDSGQENSTTICDTLGNIVFATNSYRLFDGNNVQKQTLEGGTSSTGGAIAVPDPNAPFNNYFLFTANVDPGGGGSAGPNKGINYYQIRNDGGGNITVLAGPIQLATATEVDESIGSSSDGNGGYWIIAHQRGGNQFYSWHVTSTGVNTTRATSTGSNTTPSATFQGSIKISKCQKRIAYVSWAGFLEVREWDATNGKVGALILSKTIPGFSYGAEFSPDGNMVYYTVLVVSTRLAQFEIATGIETVLSTTPINNIGEFGTMQLGPDDNIYVTNVSFVPGTGQVFIGVINDPNQAGTACNYDPNGFLLKTGSTNNFPYIYRGIVNEGWMNPTLDLDTIGNCKTIKFAYDFKTYFRQVVSIVPGSEEWDFGDGNGFQTGLGASPTFTYTAGGNFTVQLKVTDATCNKVWTISKLYTINNCNGIITPPPTCNINAVISQPTNTAITINTTDPVTVNFDGSTSTFDNTSGSTHQFYWMNGSPDTTTAFLKTNSTDLNDKSALTFQHGGALPEGTYTIYLVIRQGTCLDTTNIQLVVTLSSVTPTCNLALNAQIAPVTDFVLSENDPYVLVLDGSTSTFDNTSGSPHQFYWMFDSPDTTTAFTKTDINGLNDKTSVTFQHGTALQEGTYHVFLVIRQGLCLDTTSVTFTVTHSSVPVCNFDLIPVIKQIDDVLIDESTPVAITFDATTSIFNPSNVDPQLYYWILGSNDTSLAFSKNPTSTLTFAFNGKGGNLPQGPYDVTLVISEGLCIDSTKAHFNVTFFFLTNLVTPNGDGKNDKFYITNTPGRFDVEVYNRWGQRVFKQNGYTDGWDLSNVSDGIYYYEVVDAKTSKSYKSWVNVVSK